jgi:type VI secretion system secreted protein VgrG
MTVKAQTRSLARRWGVCDDRRRSCAGSLSGSAGEFPLARSWKTSMESYLQANRPLKLLQPTGAVKQLFPIAFRGQEAISQLFRFNIDLIAENTTTIAFEKLLGQRVNLSLDLPDGGAPRYFSGIASAVRQGKRDETFTTYHLEAVPQLWFLTRRAQSRIFQHISVPDILKQVLNGLDVDFEISGDWQPRDYCVQYRETDFHFASRLMEEEGIYYYFKHSAEGHRLVLANTPQGHAELPGGSTVPFDEVTGGYRPDMRILSWEKRQELRSGRYTLWDHHFELAHKHLEAEKGTIDQVPVGQVNHKLKLGQSDRLELYDFPGDYAHRFDAIDQGGGEHADELQKIFVDNQRTVEIRMQEESTPALRIKGGSNHRRLVSGYKFALSGHFDANGPYVLTAVQHSIQLPAHYQSGESSNLLYENSFECLPLGLPFRPARETPRPVVQGTQTAVVVGPKTEEIFTDKYGRVKVQFHWDRAGKYDNGSSCWVRVGQLWAGRRWGASFWPRVGQEVIVSFMEGDPDKPIIVGSVYNSDQLPPYLGDGPDTKHPNDNKVSGIKSNSTPGGEGYNELRFDDTKGKEQIFLHGQRNLDVRIENDCMERIGSNRHLIVGTHKDGALTGGNQLEAVAAEKHLYVEQNQVEQVNGNMQHLVGGGIRGVDGGNLDLVVKKDKKERIEGNSHLTVKQARISAVGSEDLSVGGDRHTAIGGEEHLHVKGDMKEQVDGGVSLTISADYQEKAGGKHAVDAGQEIHLKAGMKVIIEAGVQLTLKGPGGFVDINPGGVTIQGIMVLINSGGSAGSGSGSSPVAPKDPAGPKDALEAAPKTPTDADDSATGRVSSGGSY